ncbi:hypothetical protein ABVT39_017973 [Epinephelus coioides]
MGQWKLWFVLLLQLTVSVDSKENGQQLVKTIGREPDVTPICTNATEHVIILIVCWIRTERSGEECRLLYRYGEDFVHECDSRFTLLEKNQTVFLHVTSLTPADSGNYTCQCSHTGGTDTLRMNITVEVTRVRTTVREEPYVAPLCSTDSLRKDSVILCRISKEMKRGEDCTMAYRQGKDLQSDCDSRYTVITVNQTVYLHLASLTAVDSGNYTCRCPFPDGKDTLFLHMTVEVTHVKTIRRGPDVTPICSTLSPIIFIICSIRTGVKQCRLTYNDQRGFVNDCDSRLTLMTENQTVFLHLTSLTPVDSGNYSCECVHNGGISNLHLSITVEESNVGQKDENTGSSTRMLILSVLIGVTTGITITGVILGLICRRIRHGRCSRSAISGVSVGDIPISSDGDDPDDPYTSLQQPMSDVYHTISNAICLNNQEVDGRETDPSCEIYENI